MQHTYTPVALGALLSQVTELQATGHSLTQICATVKDGFEILYTFEREYALTNLRLNIDFEQEIESVSGIFPYAFLYENEMKDLFGVKIRHIRVDYNGTLYKTAVKTPFNPKPQEGESDGQ